MNLDVFSRLDRCLEGRMQAYRSPAMTLALTDQNNLIRLAAFGSASLETRTPARPDHLFAIGSIGKSFTGIAVLQAQEAGLLDVRAPVTSILPWFSVQSEYEPIAIHHLLTHSSGLPTGTDFSPDPRAEVYALRDQRAGFAPGEHFYYSDLGYKVLGLVLEAATGRTYADWISEKILAPLEMNDTYASTTHAVRSRMAVGYRGMFDDRPAHTCHPLVPAHWVETNSGDGCIVSTAEDMAKYARMLLNGGKGPHCQILSPESWRKMVTPMIEDDGEAYSYGLHLFEEDGYHHAGHGGDVPGYESYLWLDLDNRLGVAVLMTQPYTPRASFISLEYFRAVALGSAHPETPPIPDFTHIVDPEQYCGTYCSDRRVIKIEAENHHLFLVADGERILLEERSHDAFVASQEGWDLFLLHFERGAGERVTELSYGPEWFTNQHYDGQRTFYLPEEWELYTGHYRSHNPWETNFRVYARKGKLLLAPPSGDEEILTPLGSGQFRIGEDDYVPETLVFDQISDGQALRAVRSGCPYYRFFTP